jgi:MoaA/NifB/PqqE/SkfB family radical SAM enzyme
MDTRIFTCGIGATIGKLKKLRKAGLEGICVSLDHYEENIHNQKRNHKDAFRSACATIKESSKLGFYVSVVCCTTSSMVKSGEVFKVVGLAESMGAHSIQINEIRPVGRALDVSASDYFLDDDDKRAIINYYKSQNSSNRKIAVVMPWYNEESYNFGCTATAGQKVYIDAKGNVQPCELLKASIGNITENNFEEIWMHFLSKCQHPVRECIVHHFNKHIHYADILPLGKDKTFAIWPEMLKLDSTDIYKKIKVRDRHNQ